MSPVSISGVDKQGVAVNGVQVKQALNAANSTVNKGVYNATLLETVDADLAIGNIKSGITIFGVAGSASVLDVSDADAAVGDVLNPKTFYSVTGPRKTGTMATQSLNPANENVPAGYYAATTLSAVDADLAAANIKSGITIFGFTGPATVQDISAANAAVGEVLAPKTFFSVTGAIKTGTMATVALAAGANAYPAGYHAGAASLTAVDADLVAANIKNGIVIFGVTGTLTATLAEDIIGTAITALASTGAFSARQYGSASITPGNEVDIVSKSQTYAASSMAVAVGSSFLKTSISADRLKLTLYMDGVQVAVSGFINSNGHYNYVVIGTRALSGIKICKISVHNYHATNAETFYIIGQETGLTDDVVGTIGIGSIKST